MTFPALGIDVAKQKFNACLIHACGKLKHKVFANTRTGFNELLAWLEAQEALNAHACMEATGIYHEALALHLHAAAMMVSVVNPAATKAFAGSRLSRTKTDKVDAELIARFTQLQQPLAWQPPTPEVRQLQGFVRRLAALQEMRVAEGNRLEAEVAEGLVRTSIAHHLAYLDQEMKETKEAIGSLIRNNPELHRQSGLLQSIPGIGETTAAMLLAEVTDITRYGSARQVAAYAGLVPRERMSGSSVRGRPRLSKIGNARLRKGLYFPAITALRCSDYFQRWAKGLRERGKCKMSVICAAMRKLIHLVYGVLKTGQPFDPEWAKRAQIA
jgi:transposase